MSQCTQSRSALVALIALVNLSCWSPGTKSSKIIHSVKFPEPTKDDVLTVNGNTLSLSGYNALRNHLPTDLSKNQVIWIAIAALALQNDALTQGKEIPLPDAVNMAQKALTDSLTRSKFESLISQTVIQRNPQVLAEIR